MARDGYHIHTVLNSKALPKLKDQMTLAAAAAVPLPLAHFTGSVQWFPSKHAVWKNVNFFCTSISSSCIFFLLLLLLFFLNVLHWNKSLVLFRAKSSTFSDPDTARKWSRSPCRSLIHEIMGLFLSQGEPPGSGLCILWVTAHSFRNSTSEHDK